MFDIEHIKPHLSKHGYEYKKTIGIGSYSNVFLCRSMKYNVDFAIKCISHNKVKEYEYNALINLTHHHIIQLYEIFGEDEFQYLVMEYCPNETLKKKGKLEYAEFINYSRQILEALSYCHSKKIAHRDIKPDNIFLDRYGRVKLADFGFAKQFDKDVISDERCGSTMYCSPEIIKDNSLFNPFQADIYALGITFFYMITGSHPFPNLSIENLKRLIAFGQINFSNYEINSDIQSIIMKMTSHNPKTRPRAESLLKLPIYQQNGSNSFISKSKCKEYYFNIMKPQKNCIIKPVSSYFPESISEESMRKGILARKKWYTAKCDVLRPNIIKKSSQF